MRATPLEADWEVEIGGDSPVIDGEWQGLVDLRANPERVAEIPETACLPGLADALVNLNSPASAVWTAKCDVWQHLESFDPLELDAIPGAAAVAVACYVDLLPRTGEQWSSPEQMVDACRLWCSTLRQVPLRNCRADFVIRTACITPACTAIGMTTYLMACGPNRESAMSGLSAALAAVVRAIVEPNGPERQVPGTMRAARASSSTG